MLSGVVDLPWWGYVVAALVLTHITIVAVTVFLHRHQAHHALDLHPAASHFFRLWLWLTTGMKTREWAAIHRKHHAKCETSGDPHSPQVLGVNRVLWGGVFLYVKESRNRETIERYGHGTPEDWLERNIYSRFVLFGLTLMGLADVILFGMVPGTLILLAQLVWIPFWAAGVINGIGHFWGYRNWSTPDASTNILPWGILIGGEELHNNHHAFVLSAKLSNKWYEFDIGWMYIRMLEALGLATVKRVAPIPRFAAPKPVVDLQTLQAVIANRYDVLAKYASSLKRTYAEEVAKLRRLAPQDARLLQNLKRWLHRDETTLGEPERKEVEKALSKSRALQTAYSMRCELATLWGRSTDSRERLVRQLQDWCRRAETSGIGPLVEFSQRLRCYT
ncbi:MAG: aminotransferase [Betaproteobacteria bacterium RIFCSPLOWO2_02_FULL_64_12]|nr:MAG: aminotransferase [Betaproteobacteria bacterium RIFCSPLOWO2_02_FULL_64_12]